MIGLYLGWAAALMANLRCIVHTAGCKQGSVPAVKREEYVGLRPRFPFAFSSRPVHPTGPFGKKSATLAVAAWYGRFANQRQIFQVGWGRRTCIPWAAKISMMRFMSGGPGGRAASLSKNASKLAPGDTVKIALAALLPAF